MPAGQPFTVLCQQLARPRWAGRADLHVHTTHSDGSYTPAQVVELARRSGLSAVAITDHDTTAACGVAERAAGGRLDVIAGVEISAEFRGRELHLLGYYVRLDDAALQTALAGLRSDRVGRFWEMIARLRRLGVNLSDDVLAGIGTDGTLGRRNLADLLVRAGKTATVREAFQRYLADHRQAAVPKRRLPVAEAIALVRGAAGVAAWAHPTYDCTRPALAELQALGMGGVEADFPNCRPGRARDLRTWAAALGLAVTGGSDCHGPEPPGRSLGICGVTAAELSALRRLAHPTGRGTAHD
jgi:3',5'-nucleoside bisphosphate phosphatase